jgi:hypothetical protein
MATSGSGPGSPLLDEFIKGLAGWDYVVESDPDYAYNCIAHAAADDERDRWWWPTGAPNTYWPEGAPAEETVEAFVKAYGALGYDVCDNDAFDAGYEKVALYVGDDGIPKHAAKQIDPTCWTSKLGAWHDIKHPLRALDEEYGAAKIFLRRSRRA